MNTSPAHGKEIQAIGIMSGSSLDGLDIAICKFDIHADRESLISHEGTTIPIPTSLTKRLKRAEHLSGYELCLLDLEYGHWIGTTLRDILKDHPVDVIGVHGHTVFHEPTKGLSLQIGRGDLISHFTEKVVVDNFRSGDIFLGGQGAPLVPLAEKVLFKDYDGFLNIGGIANVSLMGETCLAWDVAPANQVLNHIAHLIDGSDYDRDGRLARQGRLNPSFLSRLKELPYFQMRPPKSLSNQWTANILGILPPDRFEALHTYSCFLASRIKMDIEREKPEWKGSLLVTGGGAKNKFLIESLQKEFTNGAIVVPETDLIDFKEAIAFAHLAVRKLLGLNNTLSSATGANADSCSGTLHLPPLAQG